MSRRLLWVGLALASCSGGAPVEQGVDPDIGMACRLSDPSNPCDADDIYVYDAAQKKTCQLRVGKVGTPCRAAAGPCDVAEACDGITETCPAEVLKPSGDVCAQDAPCLFSSRCNGTSASCPAQVPKPAGFTCRNVDLDILYCDVADVCDGNGNCPDVREPVGTSCTAYGNGCSGPTSCGAPGYHLCCHGTCSASGSCSPCSCGCTGGSC